MKATILCLAAFILPGVATAGKAIVCMDHIEMESALIDWYQARQAPASPVAGTDFWVSADTGAWAIVDPHPNGQACVLASGDSGATLFSKHAATATESRLDDIYPSPVVQR